MTVFSAAVIDDFAAVVAPVVVAATGVVVTVGEDASSVYAGGAVLQERQSIKTCLRKKRVIQTAATPSAHAANIVPKTPEVL